MLQLVKLALGLAALLLLAACASASFKPVGPHDTKTQGLRIPERKPLVVLMGNNVSVQWVCNYNRAQALQFGSFLAKHHMVVEFDSCGGVEKIDSNQDSTAIPLELIKVINGVAERAFAPGKATSSTSNTGILAFQIFDVRFDHDGNVTLVPQVRPGDVLRLDTGTGFVQGAGTSGQGAPAAGSGNSTDTPAIPGN
jgi:hypothetical protein